MGSEPSVRRVSDTTDLRPISSVSSLSSSSRVPAAAIRGRASRTMTSSCCMGMVRLVGHLPLTPRVSASQTRHLVGEDGARHCGVQALHPAGHGDGDADVGGRHDL